MQVLESSVLGLRSARLQLVNPSSAVQVTLFPMVHVGEPAFFSSAYEDAFGHDTVLVEGINSPIVRRITRAYRWIVKAKRLGLSVQPRYPDPSGAASRIILADLSQAEFAEVWRTVPLWLRIAVYAAAPVVGLWYRWLGTRESLAYGLTLDDLPRREETLRWNPETAPLTAAVVDARDRRLVSVLCEQLDDHAMHRNRLAIVYGAAHMRAVLHELAHRGFYANDSSWQTVFYLQ